jgi:hypothetical protein
LVQISPVSGCLPSREAFEGLIKDIFIDCTVIAKTYCDNKPIVDVGVTGDSVGLLGVRELLYSIEMPLKDLKAYAW